MGERHIRVRLARSLTVLGAAVLSVVSASATYAPSALPASKAKASSKVVARDAATRSLYDPRALGEQALRLLRVDWRAALPGWRITFLAERSGYLGLTRRFDRVIEIYVRRDRSPVGIAHDIAHEIGHAVDLTYNAPADRVRYLTLRGLPESTAWWACSGCRDLDVGAGDWAESFAQWAAPRYRFYSELAATPSEAELDRIAAQLFSVVPLTAPGPDAPSTDA